ncbi:MAG: RelA/SpoT domain-containing protein [Gemmatimonadota bacterium]|nr:RelA/SpoT domain-containing protein [Gemmatimonadota bacterium]
MKLSRMQDIGGLRAVLKNLKKVSALVEQYRSTRFQHELVSYDDYITKPKSSGYRSVHLVYRYRNPRAPLTMVCSLSSSLERDYNTLGRLPWRQLAPSLRKR